MRSIKVYSFVIPVALVVTHFLVDKVVARPQLTVFVDPSLSMARNADLTGADILSMVNRYIKDWYNFLSFS